MFGNGVGIQCFLVFPEFKNCEVVVAVWLHRNHERAVAGLLSRAQRQLLQRRLGSVALRRNRIRVRDDVD